QNSLVPLVSRFRSPYCESSKICASVRRGEAPVASGVSGRYARSRSHELLVGIAPSPVLPRLDRTHDDVAHGGGMSARVPHGGRVAAADLTTGQALAKMQ